MLAFLHTAEVHVATFEHLVRELDDEIQVRHEVAAALLAATRAAGSITDEVRADTTAAVQTLAPEGAKVIVCTCSTLGGVAEEADVADDVRVMRIDRPMAELAVASGRRIVVFAAVASTLEPTRALLHEVAAKTHRSQEQEIVEVLCQHAWPFFEAGDQNAYLGAIAAAIEAAVRPDDLILLAQASMAAASGLLGHLGLPILSSPKLGVEAALALYRAPSTSST